MTVCWTYYAAALWEEAFHFIANENSTAAERIAGQILEITDMLAAHPFAGKTGKLPGTREFAVPGTPFVFIYGVSLSEDALWVYAVYHGRRRWPKDLPRK